MNSSDTSSLQLTVRPRLLPSVIAAYFVLDLSQRPPLGSQERSEATWELQREECRCPAARALPKLGSTMSSSESRPAVLGSEDGPEEHLGLAPACFAEVR